ncbi:MAG: TIGR02449 family protein [Gammaproteobacteria bacterium]|nr:TIGR02449 family protein [Gammaproteobacteria bacterium]
MDFAELETKIDELIALVDVLEQKQAVMMAEKESLQAERTRLIEKNENARTKVEAMISRLKSLERD